jgi:hypothetical protein
MQTPDPEERQAKGGETMGNRGDHRRRISLRGRIGLATTLAAVFGLGPPAIAVTAPVPDAEREGDAAPEAGGPVGGGGDPAQDIDFDPGGAPLDLPDEPPTPTPVQAPAPVVPPAPEAAPEADAEPLESEPLVDEEALLALPEQPAAPIGEPPPEPTAPIPPSTDSPTPQAPPVAPTAPVAEATQPPAAVGPRPDRGAGERNAGRHRESMRVRGAEPRRRPSRRLRARIVLPPSSGVPAAGRGGAQNVVVAALDTQADDSRAPTGRGRSYVVRAGETLWSIAEGLLDRGASAADIAREVERLWALNATAIGTGDPDLLFAGTRLRLR